LGGATQTRRAVGGFSSTPEKGEEETKSLEREEERGKENVDQDGLNGL
jgi:hypothetical protein